MLVTYGPTDVTKLCVPFLPFRFGTLKICHMNVCELPQLHYEAVANWHRLAALRFSSEEFSYKNVNIKRLLNLDIPNLGSAGIRFPSAGIYYRPIGEDPCSAAVEEDYFVEDTCSTPSIKTSR
ncbi:hypothetical protein EVAR_24967_1 [Eumeta japonica]|uniref:Uncharacterized protein n=1 Tax=Eumeta variegata TaxID=151549 RepID=A0A4C1ZLR4_EUMVA|nr:hypothetical protein EVAR_24967_1 [Eumeta japonica]